MKRYVIIVLVLVCLIGLGSAGGLLAETAVPSKEIIVPKGTIDALQIKADLEAKTVCDNNFCTSTIELNSNDKTQVLPKQISVRTSVTKIVYDVKCKEKTPVMGCYHIENKSEKEITAELDKAIQKNMANLVSAVRKDKSRKPEPVVSGITIKEE